MQKTRKAVGDKERALMLEKHAEGMSTVAIGKLCKRNPGTVQYVIKRHKSVALTIAGANQALKEANGSILTVSLSNLCDILAEKAVEVEEVRILPKTRKCFVTIRRDLEFEV